MVRLRDRIGLNIPPLFLRLMLGVIFVWAGLGKISASTPVEGEDAALLANMGVITPSGPTTVVTPPAAPKEAPPKSAGGEAPQEKPAAEPATEKPASKPAGEKTGAGHSAPKPRTDAGAHIQLVQGTTRTYTAADFPKPVPVLNVDLLALMLSRAAHPGTDDQGAAKLPLWFGALGDGRWPVYTAWTVALTELIGGAALLLGLFTRFSALAVAGVMVGALWLTQIGPAVQSHKTMLGILPDYPLLGKDWGLFQFQFVLLMGSLALAFCGPGRLSLDRAILGGGGPDGGDDDDDE